MAVGINIAVDERIILYFLRSFRLEFYYFCFYFIFAGNLLVDIFGRSAYFMRMGIYKRLHSIDIAQNIFVRVFDNEFSCKLRAFGSALPRCHIQLIIILRYFFKMNCGTGEKENLTVLPHLLPCYISAAKMVSGKLGAPRKKHLRLYVVLFIAVGKFGNIFYGILTAIHNGLSVNKTSHKYLSIRGSVAYLLSLGTILSIPPIYFLRTSGIFTLPSAQRLFSRNAISILGGATTVLLSVCAK